MGRKVSPTSNPLGNPTTSIQALAAAVQDYLYFPDPAPLYATMGAMAANMIPGNPVWLMLVGPPSCGKTQLLDSFLGMSRIHTLSSITGPEALLSGTSKKDRAKDATGGVLREIGEYGALLIKDFTSILSIPQESLMRLLSAFREIYDGNWSRDIGGEGGRKLAWTGKLAMLGGCTQAIDRHHAVNAELGERWVYLRYPMSDGYGECKRALSGPIDGPGEMRELVANFFEALNLDWENPGVKRKLAMAEWTRIISMASVGARCRSSVSRNRYTHEVEDVPQREAPTRLATILGQLYLGMELIGLDEAERWRVTGQIALDSMPQTRRKVLDTIRFHEQAGLGVESTRDEIHHAMRVSKSAANRTIDDLELHDIIKKSVNKHSFYLTEWTRQELRRGWGQQL